ncbi:MAG: hypothetical protein LAP85_26460 [Acidobacteriia bacterium]|jgi:hypothetical protein|nr:hypothetical protein [Terriglobia bacterium]
MDHADLNDIAEEIAGYVNGGQHWIVVAEQSPATAKFIADIIETWCESKHFRCASSTFGAVPIMIAAFPKSRVSADVLREGLSAMIGAVAYTLEQGGDILYLVRPKDAEGFREAFHAMVKLGVRRPGRN